MRGGCRMRTIRLKLTDLISPKFQDIGEGSTLEKLSSRQSWYPNPPGVPPEPLTIVEPFKIYFALKGKSQQRNSGEGSFEGCLIVGGPEKRGEGVFWGGVGGVGGFISPRGLSEKKKGRVRLVKICAQRGGGGESFRTAGR